MDHRVLLRERAHVRKGVMSMLYIYTVKGESRAKELGFTDRKAGEPAFCGREPVTGTTAKAWEAKGYITKEED